MTKFNLIQTIVNNYENDIDIEHSLSAVDAYSSALLQQCSVGSCKELLEQMLNKEQTAYDATINDYLKNNKHQYNAECIGWVINLINEQGLQRKKHDSNF